MKTLALLLPVVAFSAAASAQTLNKCSAVLRQDRNVSKRDASERIAYSERVGQIEEHALRDSVTATHVLMDATTSPYLFFSFPAGNSGVAVWFKSQGRQVQLTAETALHSLRAERGLHGAQYDMKADARELAIDDSVLGSMRFIRDRELKEVLDIKIPDEVHDQVIRVAGRTVTIERKSLNGLAEYRLQLEVLGDTTIVQDASGPRFVSPTQVRLRVSGFTSEKPLTPVSARDLFKPEVYARMSQKNRDMLSFLVFKEKFMAGSPRYFSQFGRDSVFTTDALFDALQPHAIEDLLMANLDGVHEQTGELSHERSEGDFVSYERMKHGEPYKGRTGVMEEYKMVDANYAFAQLAIKYMSRYPKRAEAFLQRKENRGLKVGDLLKRNFELVERTTAAFVSDPSVKNLIRFKDGEPVGDWRDSEEGNARGPYTFNVNAALVPGSLKALAGFYGDPKSPFYDAAKAANIENAFRVWNVEAPKLFFIRVSAQNAVQYARLFMKSLGKNPDTLPEVPREGLEFFALSINEDGTKNPIMHSDDSLLMMYGHPSPAALRMAARRILLPFPYGLKTDVGIVIANPVFASALVQKRFGPEKYHGTVIWTMQEDLLQLGINRQLERSDLDPSLRAELIAAREEIVRLRKARAFPGAAEILMIKEKDGRQYVEPFAGDAKGNSNQLWSHLLDTEPGH